MKIHDSLHIDDAGLTFKFYPCDTKEAWNYNCKHNSEVVKELNWTEDSIEYKFNSHGFRCNEFNDSPAIMFLGCSLTFGIGMPKESCWTYLVSNMLGLEEFNLGNGGAANDTCFRLANYWIGKLKPEIVFYMVTFDDRLEIFDQNDEIAWNVYGQGLQIEPNRAVDHTPAYGKGVEICYPSDLNFPGYGLYKPYDRRKYNRREKDNEQKFTYEKWAINRWNGKLNRQKNVMAVKHICENYGVKFCSLRADVIEQDKKSRDSVHPGIRSNKKTASVVLDHIDEQIEFS